MKSYIFSVKNGQKRSTIVCVVERRLQREVQGDEERMDPLSPRVTKTHKQVRITIVEGVISERFEVEMS